MSKLVMVIYYLRDIILNVLTRSDIVLISEPAKWAIYDDCQNIKRFIGSSRSVRIAFTPFGLRRTLIHFASVGTLIKETGFRRVHQSNTIVMSWFHLNERDGLRLRQMDEINSRVSKVHTSCTITANQLIGHGLHPQKISIVPLGVDTALFHPATPIDQSQLRAQLGIPDSAFLIGSFQKDGDGWGAGMSPKLVKGPDLFCDTMERIAKKHPIHVLLTGPSRGYVKKRLTDAGIAYTHVLHASTEVIARYYQILDCYLISSRAEGGPKALLEAAASGVPVVATSVGMVPDIITDHHQGIVVPVGDVDAMVAGITQVRVDQALRDRLVHEGVELAARYDLRKTVPQYEISIYEPLLS